MLRLFCAAHLVQGAVAPAREAKRELTVDEERSAEAQSPPNLCVIDCGLAPRCKSLREVTVANVSYRPLQRIKLAPLRLLLVSP